MSFYHGCLVKRAASFLPWDNEHNLISKQVDVIVNIICIGVLLPLCFLVSFPTNAVNMVVFYKQGLRERINMCLFTLSLVDLLAVASVYGPSSDVMYMFLIGKRGVVGPSTSFFFKSSVVGLMGFVNASQTVPCLIALERCLCVTYPLLVKNLMSTKRTAFALWFLILAIAGGVFVCIGMRYDVICVFDTADNSTSYKVYPSKFFFRNKDIMNFFSGVIFGLFLPGISVLCVTVCTVITVVKVRNLASWRQTVSSASESLSSQDLAITRMIVGTSVLFIVCIIPSVVIRASVALIPGFSIGGRYHNLYSVMTRFFLLTSVVNSTFNFFVYYVYGSKFRQTVQEMFAPYACCHLKVKK